MMWGDGRHPRTALRSLAKVMEHELEVSLGGPASFIVGLSKVPMHSFPNGPIRGWPEFFVIADGCKS